MFFACMPFTNWTCFTKKSIKIDSNTLQVHFINIHHLFTGALTVGLVRQCQTIHGRDRTCIPPRLPPEWVTTLFFIIMGIISLTVTCGLLVASHWRREATKYARWIAFTGSKWTRQWFSVWIQWFTSGEMSLTFTKNHLCHISIFMNTVCSLKKIKEKEWGWMGV